MPPTFGLSVPVPRSLASVTSVRRTGLAAILVLAGMTLFEGFVNEGGIFAFEAFIFFVPIAAAALASSLAAQGRWRSVLKVTAGAFGIQLSLGLAVAALFHSLDSNGLGLVLCTAAVTVGGVGISSSPLLVAARMIGKRRDLEAGDAMLAVAGAWLVIAQLLKVAFATEHLLSLAPALVLGLGAVFIHLRRARARRDWSDRASRGLLEGWRVRPHATAAELATLPPLFAGGELTGVLERIEVGGSLYRSGFVAEPVATTSAPATRVPGEPISARAWVG